MARQLVQRTKEDPCQLSFTRPFYYGWPTGSVSAWFAGRTQFPNSISPKYAAQCTRTYVGVGRHSLTHAHDTSIVVCVVVSVSVALLASPIYTPRRSATKLHRPLPWPCIYSSHPLHYITYTVPAGPHRPVASPAGKHGGRRRRRMRCGEAGGGDGGDSGDVCGREHILQAGGVGRHGHEGARRLPLPLRLRLPRATRLLHREVLYLSIQLLDRLIYIQQRLPSMIGHGVRSMTILVQFVFFCIDRRRRPSMHLDRAVLTFLFQSGGKISSRAKAKRNLHAWYQCQQPSIFLFLFSTLTALASYIFQNTTYVSLVFLYLALASLLI